MGGASHRFRSTKNQFWANTGRMGVSASSSRLSPATKARERGARHELRWRGYARNSIRVERLGRWNTSSVPPGADFGNA
jgi:hypothetical protein